MQLEGLAGSEKVGRGSHESAEASAASTDVTWSAEAGRARVDVEPAEDGAATVRVSGEMDVASAPLVEHAVQILRAARRHQVRLDLSGVSFCDCAGLSAFEDSDRLLLAVGGRLTFSSVSAPVRRLMTLTKFAASSPSSDPWTNSLAGMFMQS